MQEMTTAQTTVEKIPATTSTPSEFLYDKVRDGIRNRFKTLNDEKAVFVKTAQVKGLFSRFTSQIAEADRPYYACICCRNFFEEVSRLGYLLPNGNYRNVVDEVLTEMLEDGDVHEFEKAQPCSILQTTLTTAEKNGWTHFYAFTPEEVEKLNTRGNPDTGWLDSMFSALKNRNVTGKNIRDVHARLKDSLFMPSTVGLLEPLANFMDSFNDSKDGLYERLRIVHLEDSYSWLYKINASNAGNVIDFFQDPSPKNYESLVGLINHNTDPERYKKAVREASEQALKRDFEKLTTLGVPNVLDRLWATKEDVTIVWEPTKEVVKTEEAGSSTQAAFDKLMANKTPAPQDEFLNAFDGIKTSKNISYVKFKELIPTFASMKIMNAYNNVVCFTKAVDDVDYSSVLKTCPPKAALGRKSIKSAYVGGGSEVDYIATTNECLVMVTKTADKAARALIAANGSSMLAADFKPEFNEHTRAWIDLSQSMVVPESEEIVAGWELQMNSVIEVKHLDGRVVTYTIVVFE